MSNGGGCVWPNGQEERRRNVNPESHKIRVDSRGPFAVESTYRSAENQKFR